MSASPDTKIVVKAQYQGALRRFRVNLSDCTPQVFPAKVKSLLSIADEEAITIERFSDSVGEFVVLDADVPTVYKQLYRAARAKQKLRIRIVSPTAEPVPTNESNISLVPSENTIVNSIAPASEAPVPEPSVFDENLVNDAIDRYVNGVRFQQVLNEKVEDVVKKHSTPSTPSVAESMAATIIAPPPAPKTEPKPARCPMMPRFMTFALYCNQCNGDIHGEHSHCEQCDLGDFDLCNACVEKGAHCKDEGHWMIKRVFKNGEITSSSTTSYSSPAPRTEKKEGPQLTCNNCHAAGPANQYIECRDCVFKVCRSCIDTIGNHNPKHNFERVSSELKLSRYQLSLLDAGRGFKHPAICDGCDQRIVGVRNKCLQCPDFDFCSYCIVTAEGSHPGHRFAPLSSSQSVCPESSVVHYGIICDGPLCVNQKIRQPISGDRYKCSVCGDLDFCASCEAHPLNQHDKNHPMIKLKTSNRLVSVTTMFTDDAVRSAENNMVDSATLGPAFTTTSAVYAPNAEMEVRTVVDVQPVKETVEELAPPPKPVEIKEEIKEETPLPRGPCAEFLGETISDGTVIEADTTFIQTWAIRCVETAWPAGTTVKFSGGSYMFEFDNNLGATVTERETQPGEIVEFSVKLRAPPFSAMHSKFISYWHLVTDNGTPFGPSLWCEISVAEPKRAESTPSIDDLAQLSRKTLDDLHQVVDSARAKVAESVPEKKEVRDVVVQQETPEPTPVPEVKEEVQQVVVKKMTEEDVKQMLEEVAAEVESNEQALEENSAASSQLIFPTIPKESPASSTHGVRLDQVDVDVQSVSDGFMSPRAESEFASSLGDEEFEYFEPTSDDEFELLGTSDGEESVTH